MRVKKPSFTAWKDGEMPKGLCWCKEVSECPRVFCTLLSFFLPPGSIVVRKKNWSPNLDVSLWLVHLSMCICRECVHMHVYASDHGQTDEGKDRKAHFIYRFTLCFTVLFWRVTSSCLHCFTMTSHELQYVSLNKLFNLRFHIKISNFLKEI